MDHKTDISKILKIVLILLIVPLLFSKDAESQDFTTTIFEDGTMRVTEDFVGHFYLYMNNDKQDPLELKIEFTKGENLIDNLKELQEIRIPPGAKEYPVRIDILAKDPGSYAISYTVFDTSVSPPMRFGPRGTINLIVESPIQLTNNTEAWDVIALRTSFMFLLALTLLISTIMVGKRITTHKEEKKNNNHNRL